jgi:hypothetical protein
MSHSVEVKPGQSFQDGTGLKVRIAKIDLSHRVHFYVTRDREDPGTELGLMSSLAFVSRFTRIDSAEEACARVKHLGYVASRHIRIYGEEFELLSDPFPDADQIAIRAKAKGDSRIRTLRLPLTIVQNGSERTPGQSGQLSGS